MSNFATMLDFFTPETDTVTIACEDCGRLIDVPRRCSGIKRQCKECHAESIKQNAKSKRGVDQTTQRIGEPTHDLVLAVIRQAQYDAKRGDYQAREYLEADDGAELLLRSVGIPIDEDTHDAFKRLSYRTAK